MSTSEGLTTIQMKKCTKSSCYMQLDVISINITDSFIKKLKKAENVLEKKEFEHIRLKGCAP